MAHGLNSVLRRGPSSVGCKEREGKSGIGSRRIFAPHFKLQVLDSYRNDADCKGNQRATARKYGIHRRQIQKWLQCENNLRNSVGKGKAASPEARKCGAELSLRSGQHRQRDDLLADAYSQSAEAFKQTPPVQDALGSEAYSQNAEARLPTLTTAPLDYTMHSRSLAASPIDPTTPMDLSFKRPQAASETSAPVCCPRVPSPSTILPTIQPHHPDIWDLSIRNHNNLKRTYEESNITTHSPNSPINESQPKPVKLFKPYLDDLNDDFHEEKPKIMDILPPCCNSYISPLVKEEPHYYNNNHISPEYIYTLHELQPKNTINYYYTINKNYIYSPQCDGMSFCTAYDSSGLLHHGSSPPLKQRQSYSLDFKLSAIECYYQDSMCRGNQRAVASKYNIHRRQVQKWLKQEEELRNRIETTKHMNVVR